MLCAGYREYFIRNSVAYDISEQMLYLGKTPEHAAGFTINEKQENQVRAGRLIPLDKNENITTLFNAPGRFIGFVTMVSRPAVQIF